MSDQTTANWSKGRCITTVTGITITLTVYQPLIVRLYRLGSIFNWFVLLVLTILDYDLSLVIYKISCLNPTVIQSLS